MATTKRQFLCVSYTSIDKKKTKDILDVGEEMLHFSGSLDFSQGLQLTCFYLP